MLHFRRGTVGARHAPMRQLPTFERQNSTKKPPGQRKSPLLLTEGGTAQAVTGVEGTRCNLRTAWKDDRRATSPFRGGIRTAGFGVERAGHAAAPTRIFDTAYRPSSVTPSGVPLSSGMTATGSHVYFLFAARGTTPRGRRFLPRRGIYRNSAAYTPSVCLYRQTAPPAQGSHCPAGGAHPFFTPPYGPFYRRRGRDR